MVYKHPLFFHFAIVALIFATIFALRSRRHRAANPILAGGLYSVIHGPAFAVVKVLVLTPGAVHVRLYQQRFGARPKYVDPSTLTLGPHDDPTGFSIGHFPVATAGFLAAEPQHIATLPVEPDELDGFTIWREAEGGIWNSF